MPCVTALCFGEAMSWSPFNQTWLHFGQSDSGHAFLAFLPLQRGQQFVDPTFFLLIFLTQNGALEPKYSLTTPRSPCRQNTLNLGHGNGHLRMSWLKRSRAYLTAALCFSPLRRASSKALMTIPARTKCRNSIVSFSFRGLPLRLFTVSIVFTRLYPCNSVAPARLARDHKCVALTSSPTLKSAKDSAPGWDPRTEAIRRIFS